MYVCMHVCPRAENVRKDTCIYMYLCVCKYMCVCMYVCVLAHSTKSLGHSCMHTYTQHVHIMRTWPAHTPSHSCTHTIHAARTDHAPTHQTIHAHIHTDARTDHSYLTSPHTKLMTPITVRIGHIQSSFTRYKLSKIFVLMDIWRETYQVSRVMTVRE
jgi:hypothetical protein